jgi:hypothetical protein
MSSTLTYTGQLVTETCWCGIHFAIPASLQREIQAKRHDGHCPLGHTYIYGGKTEAQKLKEQLELKERQLASERARRDQAEADAAHERNRVRGYQGALGKAKKRAAKGVCPAAGCKRSFVDVARHVATCHPDLVATEAEA